MKKAGRYIANILAVLIIVVLVSVPVLYLFGYETCVVMSGSMEPAITTGSLCLIDQNSAYEDIRTGDVVAYDTGSMTVAHRAIAVTEDGVETKGDANDNSDGIAVTADNFVGTVRAHVPYIGYFFLFLQTFWGKAVIIIAVVLLLLAAFMPEKKKKTSAFAEQAVNSAEQSCVVKTGESITVNQTEGKEGNIAALSASGSVYIESAETADTGKRKSVPLRVSGRAKTGNIAISLVLSAETAGVPDEELPVRAVISASGGTCYIRVAVEYDGGKLSASPGGFDSSWTAAKDGYWYYREPLEDGRSIPAFRNIHIPVQLGKTDTVIFYTVTAQAIPGEGFCPDFTAENPWEIRKIAEDIVESVKTDDAAEKDEAAERDKAADAAEASEAEPAEVKEKDAENANGSVDLILLNDEESAQEIICGKDNLFAAVKSFAPGASYEDSLTIQAENITSLYFSGAPLQPDSVYGNILLTVIAETPIKTSTRFSGPLSSDTLEKGFTLATFGMGESGKLTFTLQVPEDYKEDPFAEPEQIEWLLTGASC